MNTFKKEEKLFKINQIEALFSKGASFFSYPFKLLWIEIDEDEVYPARLLISVPKKNFKRAVDRNHIKRLIREAYRLNKSVLYDCLNNHQIKINIAFIYTQKDILSFHEIEKQMILTLRKICTNVEKHIK